MFPQETGKNIEHKKFKLVHLDVDTYISYKECLEFFYDKMIIGGYMIFDDYHIGTCEGADKAIDEFFENKEEKVITDQSTATYIIKL